MRPGIGGASLRDHLDELTPAVPAWRAKSMKSGLSNWVRSTQAYEIPV
jgi:hypothetical protein